MTATLTKRPPALQYSSRLKLNDLQRDQLRAAFNEKINEANPESVGRGGIRVTTSHASDLESRLGCDRITFSSLIASRESIAIPVVLRFQKELGVHLIDEDEMKAAFDSYLSHLRESYSS